MSDRESIHNQPADEKRKETKPDATKPSLSPRPALRDDASFLQNTIGNRALYGMFRSGVLQPKPREDRSGDLFEQEADRASEGAIGIAHAGRPKLSAVGTTIQRAPVEAETPPAATPAAPAPEKTEAPSVTTTTEEAKIPTPGLVVDDAAKDLLPGQMRKSEFLARLRGAVCATAESALSGTVWSAMGCPWIDYWFGYYGGRDAQSIERAIQRYTGAGGAAAAADYIPIICARVSNAIAQWSRTGEVKGVPEGVPTGLPGMPAPSNESGPAVSRKAQEGGAGKAADPQAVRSRLDSGSLLESGVRSQMESAFGQDFSGVRVHTDSNAGNLSDELHARAFTVGKDIAFASGEYKPGTLIGDALIAHELAHVVQQGGGATAPLQKGEAESGSLEEEADTSAVGAMVSLRGGIKGGFANIAWNAMPRLKSGLRLQRCSDDKKPEEAFIPLSAEEVEALARIKQDIALAEGLLSDPALSDEEKAMLKSQIDSARSALGSYASLRSQGETRAYIIAPIATASAGIAADDATVVGVADDPLLIVLGLAAIATYIFTSGRASREALTNAWMNVGYATSQLAAGIETIVLMTAAGNVVHDYLVEEARKLAVALGLAATAGEVTREMVCEMLKKMAEQNRRTDTDKWKKIISTMKGLGCRHSRASK